MDKDLIVEDLIEELKNNKFSEKDIDKIYEAYSFAYKLHAGQYRISEEPYIIHPVEVAKILAGLINDVNTIIAALLHDILEDTETEEEEIKEAFGDDVLSLVKGVTKLGQYQFKSKEERQAENFRRMFISMANDIRVIFLKLADRLHNMRTLNYMANIKQKRIAQETLDIFAPLANRLGMGKVKAELEDLSLRYINPEKYFEIAQLISQKKAERDSTVQLLIDKISTNLKHNKIKATIQGRSKHYYSIYSKMKRLNLAFHDLYDITAVRVILDNEKDCYEVLGLIHSEFKPIPGRFKDYIAMPKSNMYRSLHTSVIGPRSKPLEVQIRTKEMHEIAEYGVASHWKYKESGVRPVDSEADRQFSWMKKMLEMNRDSQDAQEFVNNVKMDLFSNQVFAFTPMGDVIDLPQNATALDFAYRIHTEVGHKTTGVLINGRISSLGTKIKNGDIIEVLTAKDSKPKLDWLSFVTTKQASSKIRAWFKKYNRDEHINIGKANLEHHLTKSVFDEYQKEGKFIELSKEMNYASEDDLFASVGYGETTINKIMNKLHKPAQQDITSISTQKKKKTHQNDIEGLDGLLYKLSKCCSPIPGEEIVGVVTRGKGVSVHRSDCNCLLSVEPERLLNIHWSKNPTKNLYQTVILIETNDKLGVLKDVLTQVSEMKVNITFANVKSFNKKYANITLGVEVNNIDILKKVMLAIQSLPDVYKVKRKNT